MRPTLLFLVLLLAACSGCNGATQAEIDAVMGLSGNDAPGETVYLDNCATCHVEDGSGGFGPSLIFHVPKHDDEYLVALIIDGQGDMPSFASLGDQEIADVLTYLRGTFGEQE